MDQGRDYMALRNIVVNHHMTLIGSEIGGGYAGITGIFQGPFHYYFLAIPFILFHGDPYGGIVLMFLFSIAAIVGGFFIGNKIFGKPFGYVTALFIALSPPFISAARFVWNPHPSVFFMLLAFYAIFSLATKNRNAIAIFFAGFLVSFTYNFEIAMTVPLIISLILYVIFVQRLSTIKDYGILFLGLLVPFVPMILFEIKHNFLAVHGFLHYISQPHSTKGYGLINNHFDAFFLNVWDTFPHILPTANWIFSAILFIPTIVFLWFEKNIAIKKLFLYFFLVIGAEIFVLSFLRNHIFMYYLLDLNSIYIFFFVYILWATYHKQKLLFGIFLCFLLLLTLYGSINAYTTTRHDLGDYGGLSKIKGHTDAIDYIYKDAHGLPFGLFIFTPNVFTDPFDYTVLWYGQEKYHYLPTKNMHGIFYLLMQPDPYNPTSYIGWEQTVIKSGKVLKTITLPSGLIVEKREG